MFFVDPSQVDAKNVLFLHTKGGSTIPHIDLPKINKNSALKFLHLGRSIPKAQKAVPDSVPLVLPHDL